jgi:hypothetical protein
MALVRRGPVHSPPSRAAAAAAVRSAQVTVRFITRPKSGATATGMPTGESHIEGSLSLLVGHLH